jgi:hypothetical protein
MASPNPAILAAVRKVNRAMNIPDANKVDLPNQLRSKYFHDILPQAYTDASQRKTYNATIYYKLVTHAEALQTATDPQSTVPWPLQDLKDAHEDFLNLLTTMYAKEKKELDAKFLNPSKTLKYSDPSHSLARACHNNHRRRARTCHNTTTTTAV